MEKDEREPSHSLLIKDKKDGTLGEGQGGCGDDQPRPNRVSEAVKDGGREMVRADALMSVSQQPSRGNVVYWERFLHVRSIKVLLVENDDCTRHVVTALLRNCNYEVVKAANGLQAWKILQDLSNHIDLVLTEVVMPCVSGVALLYKIMSHKTRKNLPVIMMSSHDSMGLVFKCLSKGAVDFLVKPIRKNELKNLWQHVWRRCHSSSGSGSESGTNTVKSVKSKSIEKMENNCNSSDENDYRSIGFTVGDDSDSGSGAQSSWTKQDAEVNSLRAASPGEQIDECPDSTCAQVIRPNNKASGGKCMPVTTNRKCQEKEENLNDLARGKDLVIKGPGNEELQRELSIEAPVKLIDVKEKAISQIDSNTCTKKLDLGIVNPKGESPSTKSDTINSSGLQTENEEFKAPASLAKALVVKDKVITDSRQPPEAKLSSKRNDDCNILRHSEVSAFSRYTTASNAFKAPNENTGSGSPPGQSLDGAKNELGYSSEPPQQSSNRVNNINIDMGSTTNNDFAYLVDVKDKSEAMSTCVPQSGILLKVDDRAVSAPSRGSCQEPSPSQHLQKHCSHVGTEHKLLCGSSNELNNLANSNVGNYSLNKSASGSNHGSNGHNGSSTADNAGAITVKSVNVEGGENRSGNASGSGSGNNTDQEMLAPREAALNKYRQKRKERCFEKKVRYQSRKRLADQRPRARGQFVRQSEYESSSGAADS